MKKKLGAVITAAGMSKRMGAFKPLLPLGDSTVIESQIAAMRGAGCETVVVVLGYRAAEVEAAIAPYDVRVVYNPDYATTDMFTSVCIGIRAVQPFCDAMLFAPVDAAAFSQATVDMILASGSPVVAPIHGGRQGHPIYIDGKYIPAVLSHDGTNGLRGALEATGVCQKLYVPDAAAMLDADTPEDYEKLVEAAKSSRA